jgi:hypothetical protein
VEGDGANDEDNSDAGSEEGAFEPISFPIEGAADQLNSRFVTRIFLAYRDQLHLPTERQIP